MYHIIIKLTDGTLLACGSNHRGELGLGDTRRIYEFTEIKSAPKNIAYVECGYLHTFIRLTDGTLMSCGANSDGQLGHGDSKYIYLFSTVRGIPRNVSYMSCGGAHTVIKITDMTCGLSTLMSCGANRNGELGLGDNTHRYSFTKIKIDLTIPFDILCHSNHTN